MSTLEFVPTTKNNILALVSHVNPKNPTTLTKEEFADQTVYSTATATATATKGNIDPVFHFYLGSLSVVGLFVLFRMIQKN